MRPAEHHRHEPNHHITDDPVSLGDGEDDQVPWVPVTPGEVQHLLAAYRQAQAFAEVLRGLLLAAGLPATDLPVIVASVDADGEPVVRVSRLDQGSWRRLECLWHETRRAQRAGGVGMGGRRARRMRAA